MSKQYALLVGIDCYLQVNCNASSKKIRKFENGEEVFLPNLKGCLHDVKTIETLLLKQYNMSPDDITVLSSSLPNPLVDVVDLDLVQPVEPSTCLPTFDNIKRAFESVCDKATSGDLFFFHFSGHGARLPRVPASPPTHITDPSLLTVDYCLQGRAVRGWELNRWLKHLNTKGVRVVVSLDSCYSGGAWPSGTNVAGYRTPEKWGSVINLPTDEDDIVPDSSDQPEYRYGDLKKSWSLNPENFTLMTACGVDQKAAELFRNDKVGGHFTHALLDYLEKNKYHVTYRMALEHLQQELQPQRPEIHGRDRILFFGNSEPFMATPVKVRVEGERLRIPAGRAHGVRRGSEFVPFGSSAHGTITVDTTEEFTSSSLISSETRKLLLRHHDTIVPSRWCFAEESVLRVILDQGFEPAGAFAVSLLKELASHIASAIQITRDQEFANAKASKDTVFTLQVRRWDGVRIRGPESLVGYNGPVQPLKIRCPDEYSTVEELAAAVATPLVHLSRFSHTLQLTSASSSSLSYEVSISPANGTPKMPPYPRGQSFTYYFKNTDMQKLFFVIFSIGPEFGIKQFWPITDKQQEVAPGERVPVRGFHFSLPDAPPQIGGLHHCTSRREIIRTLVTTREGVSWKILEMPNIWDAHRLKMPGISDLREAVFDVSQGCDEWSVSDNYIVVDC